MPGVFSVAVANAALQLFATDALFIQLHTGDPGAAGTSNVASVSTRQPVIWGTQVGGVMQAANSPEWPMWAGTDNEVITHLSFWSASSGGTFAGSCPVDSSVTMLITDNLTLHPLSFTIPTAA